MTEILFWVWVVIVTLMTAAFIGFIAAEIRTRRKK